MTDPNLRIETTHPIPTEENAGLVMFALLHSYLEIAKQFPAAQVDPDLISQARKVLAETGVPPAPFSKSVAGLHIAWLHYWLREAGHCIDGGVCHHGCDSKSACAREGSLRCAPLTGSALDEQWTLEGNAPPKREPPAGSFDPGAAARLRSIVDLLGVSAPESDADMMDALFAVQGNVRASIQRLFERQSRDVPRGDGSS